MDICNELLDTSHALIAGTTGSGKSVLLNSVICRALERYMVLSFIDLKRVELRDYRFTEGCLDYADDPSNVWRVLDRAIWTMENRYQKMVGKKSDAIPYFVVIDELADLASDVDSTEKLVKIGRLGRASNVHLLCATQDPSRNTLKAQLMQNFTATVALRCRSAIESRQIIGVKGAESLPLYGEGFLWNALGIRRFEVPMTPEDEIKRICKEHAG